MTRLDSFLFGLALVGFCAALAVADEPPTLPYDGCKSLRDAGHYCLEIQVPPGGINIDCLSSDPKACPPNVVPDTNAGQVLVVDPATGEERWVDLDLLCRARTALKSRSFR